MGFNYCQYPVESVSPTGSVKLCQYSGTSGYFNTNIQILKGENLAYKVEMSLAQANMKIVKYSEEKRSD